MGVTGTKGANITARDADLIIGIGTRYSDFTTASKTAFANPSVRFININVAEFDAHKHNALSLVADARVTLTELGEKLSGWSVDDGYRNNAAGLVKEWDAEVERIYSHDPQPLPAQGAVFGAINSFSDPHDVVVNAAGSGPGDLHKLWRTRDPKGYHIEYGYSCMGYEIPGGLGIKLAAPEREVYVVVGDGSYLMMPQDIVTAVQEGIKLTIVLVDNHGFASIGGLSEALGSAGFGTEYRFRSDDGQLKGTPIPVDYAANARSLGAHTIVAKSIGEFKEALVEAKAQSQTTVIVIETEREERVGGYESWWDVPIAEVSEVDEVNAARADYEKALLGERSYHAEGKQ
jgi:3D-(3,5/4)-trihydroxycyclohexane-1,2-dione acylhydrolase (decyclizing)